MLRYSESAGGRVHRMGRTPSPKRGAPPPVRCPSWKGGFDEDEIGNLVISCMSFTDQSFSVVVEKFQTNCSKQIAQFSADERKRRSGKRHRRGVRRRRPGTPRTGWSVLFIEKRRYRRIVLLENGYRRYRRYRRAVLLACVPVITASRNLCYCWNVVRFVEISRNVAKKSRDIAKIGWRKDSVGCYFGSRLKAQSGP